MRAFDPDILSQALAEPSRRAILENLRYGQKSVSEIVTATKLKQPNVSNHLAKMREQGLVRSERIGRLVFYSISSPFAELLMRLHEFAVHPLDHESSTGTTSDNRGAAELSHAVPNAQSNERAEPGPEAPQEISTWANAYFHAILAGQEDRASALVNMMLADRLDMETIYLQVFSPALYRIGEMYLQGLTDEAHEHVASGITERMMAKVSQFYVPVGRVGRRAVLGCVAGNWHTLGIRMLADGLKTLGWETLFVGANVPTASFVSMVHSARPDLVVVSCALEEQWPETLRLITDLDRARHEAALSFQVAVGGHCIEYHRAILPTLPIDFAPQDMAQFMDEVQARFASH